MYCICGEGSDSYPDVPPELKAGCVHLLASFNTHSLGNRNTVAPNEQAK